MLHYRLFLTVLFTTGLFTAVFAQSGNGTLYGPVQERQIVETKWKYAYALHVESNTIIHQAEDYYDFFLYFRYDYSYRQYLNGKFSNGDWSLNNRTLFYSFNNIPQFQIYEIGKQTMILEFSQSNSRGTYQYHFVRVNSQEAPFDRAANELPEVLVEDDGLARATNNWVRLTKKDKKKRNWRFWERNKAAEEEEPELAEYFAVELIGGGFYGGVDPVLKDFIQIKRTGRLVKEFQSVHNGLVVTKAQIPIDELQQFADWVKGRGFFELERIYDCASLACRERSTAKPHPIPLRLMVAYGQEKKVVTIMIYGKDNRADRYVDYPPILDEIIESVRKMADRYDESVVRR